MNHLSYFESFDIRQILSDYPLGDDFTLRLAVMRFLTYKTNAFKS